MNLEGTFVQLHIRISRWLCCGNARAVFQPAREALERGHRHSDDDDDDDDDDDGGCFSKIVSTHLIPLPILKASSPRPAKVTRRYQQLGRQVTIASGGCSWQEVCVSIGLFGFRNRIPHEFFI